MFQWKATPTITKALSDLNNVESQNRGRRAHFTGEQMKILRITTSTFVIKTNVILAFLMQDMY